jgi:cyclopropane fatty-acyl-phospholipid synthase-like methyltransferase
VSTDEQLLGSLTHRSMRWNTPLSPERADHLIGQLEVRESGRIVDLGCGWGGLLLRALGTAEGWTGEGVDENPSYVARANENALSRGMQARVRFVQGDIRRYAGSSDRLICIGANHAWSTLAEALVHLRSVLASEGRMLLGCGYWERPPTPELIDMLGVLPTSIDEVERQAVGTGWRVQRSEPASRAEWDVFESEWARDLEEIASGEGSTSLGRQAERIAQQRRAEYFEGYRGVLGFVYLILRRPVGPSLKGHSTGTP